jgi:hypothetical protein
MVHDGVSDYYVVEVMRFYIGATLASNIHLSQ